MSTPFMHLVGGQEAMVEIPAACQSALAALYSDEILRVCNDVEDALSLLDIDITIVPPGPEHPQEFIIIAGRDLLLDPALVIAGITVAAGEVPKSPSRLPKVIA